MDYTAEFYSRPSYHFRGSGFPIYSGARRQKGGSIFGALKSFALPLLKSFARKGAKQAISFASDVADDVMSGRKIKDTLISRGKTHALQLGKNIAMEGLTAAKSFVGSGRVTRKRKRRPQTRKGTRQTKKRRTANF